jgi:hypothetical protein
MRRAGLVTAVLLAVLAGACETSKVDPDAEVRVSGNVLAPNGSPAADRPVRLGGGVGDDDAGLALLTLGLSCAGGGCTGKVFDATTTSSGDFTFTLKGRDTQGTFGKVRSQLVTVSAAPGEGQVSGAAASARFNIQTERVSLPTLALVDPQLRVVPVGKTIATRWSTRRAGPYEVTFEGSSAVPVWRARTAQSAASVDGRVLEDTAGRVVLSGGSKDRIEGSDVTLGWRSPGLPYASTAGGPPSRGSLCTFGTAADAPAQQACPLTDGDLSNKQTHPSACPTPASSGASPPAGGCTRLDLVTILLPRPLRPDLIVLRGCGTGCPVSTSPDGKRFRPAGTASGGYATLRLDRRTTTAIRIRVARDELREVSVWEPLSEARPPLQPLDERSLQNLRKPYAVPDEKSDWRLYLLAGALVLVVAVGIAYQLGRRQR